MKQNKYSHFLSLFVSLIQYVCVRVCLLTYYMIFFACVCKYEPDTDRDHITSYSMYVYPLPSMRPCAS